MERTEVFPVELINRLKEETFRLISIPSHRDCSQINEYIKERLSFIPFKDQPVGKRNLYNIYSVSLKKPVLINTHVDTVPPITMKNPFNPVEKDGKIYGRGAADTKGLIAALIIALEDFKKNFPDKEIPVSVAFTVDEEQNTALGSERLVQLLDGIKSVLVLEPTYGRICTRQMGAYEFVMEITVPSAHGAEFEKFKNPSKEAFRFVQEIEKSLSRPVNIIKFHSGWEHYAVPEKATLLCEFKLFEGEKVEDIEKSLQTLISTENISVKIEPEDYEEFLSFKKGNLYRFITQAYREVFRKKPEEGVMSSWTDASNYHRVGKECIVFGFGSLSDSHTDREHISVEELLNNYMVIYKLLTILSQS